MLFRSHFPLVLIVAAIFCDLRGNHEAGYRLTLWAAPGAALAILTGLLLVGGQVSELPVHAGLGITSGIVAVVLAMLRYSQRAREEEMTKYSPALLVVEVLAVLGIVAAAITGHRAVLGR